MEIIFGATVIILMIIIFLLLLEIVIALDANPQQVHDAQKPAAINIAGAVARTEVDRIIARYSREIDQILHPESSDQAPSPQVIFLNHDEYQLSMEEPHVS